MNVSFNGNGQILNKFGTAIKNNKYLEKARNVPPSAIIGAAIVLGAGAYAAHMASKAGHNNFTPITGIQPDPNNNPSIGANLSING